MDFSSHLVSVLVFSLLVVSSFCPVHSLDKKIHHINKTTTFRPQDHSKKLKLIRAHLKKINKPPIKTIQSPDGDLIDCVISHQQPAFDHPLLKGKKPLDLPERPFERSSSGGGESETFQLWSMSGEFCPEGTVPIRRTTEKDMLRASSVQRFGRKVRRRIRRDSSSNGHEHAVGFVSGEEYYGAKASINVWAPRVTNQYEFSLSQMWVISGSFGDDLNTIEAGWQVSPELYGDNYPRFFTYWTNRHWSCNFSNIFLQWRPIRHQSTCLEGSETWELVVGIRVGRISRVLAGIFIHSPSKPRNDDPIRRRGGEFAAVGVSHGDANGERPFRRRRIWKSFVFS
ncbi:uncharacterized protein LOC120080834 isoform X2 [Benincasa hispida]|uniref:uncharacterized protein LOC120080834 isoform X2 n=1 Tax=Benincasa hispida TaxID=102211 RepID=UPI0018FFCD2F|nr:uncharacterized protein LOC120080834 isoform X2 [Benincasa hispida]